MWQKLLMIVVGGWIGAQTLIIVLRTFKLEKYQKGRNEKRHRQNKDNKQGTVKEKQIPRIGGIVLGIILIAGIAILLPHETRYYSIIGAIVLLILGGVQDDLQEQTVKEQLIWQVGAIITAIVGGILVYALSNPFGSMLQLGQYSVQVPVLGYTILYISIPLTALWLFAMMNITNWIDGVDGLATGVGLVASCTVLAISLRPGVEHAAPAILAALMVGALIAIFQYNKTPAKIYLGTSGSIMIGFMLGIISIMSGSKVATTLLVMSLPIADAGWVIVKRALSGKPIHKPDLTHLHYRLKKLKFSTRQIVMIITGISVVLGVSAILLQTKTKLVLWPVVIVVAIITLATLTYKSNK